MIRRYLTLLRPHQWLKNLLLFFPPFFGGKILDPAVITVIIPSFLSFSLAASCGYIINDLKDRESDRHHEGKKDRPFVRGDVSVVFAIFGATLLYIAAMLLSAAVSPRFEGYLVIYLFISVLYTFFFKDVVIMDIFFISFGFLVRVMAGGEAFQIPVSSWLFLTVFIVSLLLSAGKRLGELILLKDNAHKHRKSLINYSESFLEGILWFAASSALVAYALYTIENRGIMLYTVPLAAFGLLRYIYAVKQGRGDPTDALLHDPQISGAGVLWLLVIALIKYK
jgi:decaprenyl-phosphate phosphoribosyltransferase